MSNDRPKPIVRFYGSFMSGSAWPFSNIYIGILHDAVGHPKLGDQDTITTSMINKITIETQNTVYVWEGARPEEDDEGEQEEAAST